MKLVIRNTNTGEYLAKEPSHENLQEIGEDLTFYDSLGQNTRQINGTYWTTSSENILELNITTADETVEALTKQGILCFTQWDRRN